MRKIYVWILGIVSLTIIIFSIVYFNKKNARVIQLNEIEDVCQIYDKLPDSIFVSFNLEFLEQDIERNGLYNHLTKSDIQRLKKKIRKLEIRNAFGNGKDGITFILESNVSWLSPYTKNIFSIIYFQGNISDSFSVQNVNQEDIMCLENIRNDLYQFDYNEKQSWRL